MKEILNSIKNSNGLFHNIKKDLKNIISIIIKFKNYELDDNNIIDDFYDTKKQILEKFYTLNEYDRLNDIANSNISKLESGDLSEVLFFASLELTNKINNLNEEITSLFDNELIKVIKEIDSNLEISIVNEDCAHFIDLNNERFILNSDTDIILLKEQIEEIIFNNINIDR